MDYKKLNIIFLISLFLIHCSPINMSSGSELNNVLLFSILKKKNKFLTNSTKESCYNKNPNITNFWVLVISNKSYQCVSFVKYKETQYYNFWLQVGLDKLKVLDEIALQIGDISTYLTMVSNFGTPRDINSDGKIDIIISDRMDTGKNNSYVSGYVRPDDYFSQERSNFSNERDMLYLNYKLIKSKNTSSILSTTIHELQHLIRLSYQIDEQTKEYNPDSYWINEGTSEYASDIAGFGPQKNRIECFNNKNSCGGVNGISLFAQPNNQYSNRSSVTNYSLYYAFLSFLYQTAASNKKDVANFVYKVTTGYNKVSQLKSERARKVESLIGSYMLYSGEYLKHKKYFGSDKEIVFGKLYILFLILTSRAKFEDSSTVELFDKNGIKKDVTNDIRELLKVYKLPSYFEGENGLFYLPVDLSHSSQVSLSQKYFESELISGTNLYLITDKARDHSFSSFKSQLLVKNLKVSNSNAQKVGIIKINNSFTNKKGNTTIMPSLKGESHENKGNFDSNHSCIQNQLQLETFYQHSKQLETLSIPSQN